MACNIPSFNPQAFRTAYPEFTCGKEYPDQQLQAWWNLALVYVPNNPYGVIAQNNQFPALQMMTAHLAKLMTNAGEGELTGIVTDASIDKVAVGLQPPPEKSQYQWWLNQTPYGQALLALFQVQTVGGIYSGGSLDLQAFRRPGRVYLRG